MISNDYLKSNNIQELFEALTDSLILSKPVDIVQHLQDALENVKSRGLEKFKIETFHTSLSNIKNNQFMRDLFQYKSFSDKKMKKEDSINHLKIIIILSAPGELKQIGQQLSEIFFNCGYLNLGTCLRNRIAKESQKGISTWKVNKSLLQNGDFVTDEIALGVLLDEMKTLSSKDFIIIEGYPKNIKQAKDFDNAIGTERIIKVFLIDSVEIDCQNALLANYSQNMQNPEFNPYESYRKLANYKAYTLPVLKYFQDSGLLVILENESQISEILKKITKLLNVTVPELLTKVKNKLAPLTELSEKRQIVKQKIKDGTIKFIYSSSDAIYNAEKLHYLEDPIKRSESISKIPLVIIQGSPKSGKTRVAKQCCDALTGWYHYDFSQKFPNHVTDLNEYEYQVQCCEIRKQFETINSFAAGIILEHYPKSALGLRIFNQEIGKVDLQLFIDCSDFVISSRFLTIPSIYEKQDDEDLSPGTSIIMGSMLDNYKKILLPIIKFFSDRDLSFNIDGNQDIDKISSQFINVLKAMFY